MSRFISWRDAAVITGILAVAFLVFNVQFFTGKTAEYAEVWVEGQLALSIPLGQSIALYTPVPGVTVAAGHSTRFLSSDCRDPFCVRTGALLSPGNVAVCLPHRVMLRVTGAQPGGLDAVTG